jgi:hypothetical protein
MLKWLIEIFHIISVLTRALYNPNNYGRALMSAPPQGIAPSPHINLLNVNIQIANKMEFQQQKEFTFSDVA